MDPAAHSLELRQSGPRLLHGAAGDMEVIFDVPARSPVGMAIVAHPQPLLGGNAMHKVPHLLARALCEAGWIVARPNFRVVGRSAGTHAAGIGETEDVLALRKHLLDGYPSLRLGLLGFSFGAFVQARVARALADGGTPAWRVCLAGMPAGEVAGQRHYDTPANVPDALVVHGERDERVPLASVFEWARPQAQPVVVVPGADHFFTGRLHILRALVLSHFAG